MTYHYSPEGANYHNEGKPPREPSRDGYLGYAQDTAPLEAGALTKDAEIERLKLLQQKTQEQYEHYIDEAESEAEYYRGVASFYMKRAYDWEQAYDELFATLNPKCSECDAKGFTFGTRYTEGGQPYNIMVPCVKGCGPLPAGTYMTWSTEEQLGRTRSFIAANVDTGLQA